MKLKDLRKLTDVAYQEALSKREKEYNLAKANFILEQLEGKYIPGWYFDEMIGIKIYYPYSYQCSGKELHFHCSGFQNPFLNDLSGQKLLDKILSWYDLLISDMKLVPFISIDEWNEQHPVSKDAIRNSLRCK